MNPSGPVAVMAALRVAGSFNGGRPSHWFAGAPFRERPLCGAEGNFKRILWHERLTDVAWQECRRLAGGKESA